MPGRVKMSKRNRSSRKSNRKVSRGRKRGVKRRTKRSVTRGRMQNVKRRTNRRVRGRTKRNVKNRTKRKSQRGAGSSPLVALSRQSGKTAAPPSSGRLSTDQKSMTKYRPVAAAKTLAGPKPSATAILTALEKMGPSERRLVSEHVKKMDGLQPQGQIKFDRSTNHLPDLLRPSHPRRRHLPEVVGNRIPRFPRPSNKIPHSTLQATAATRLRARAAWEEKLSKQKQTSTI